MERAKLSIEGMSCGHCVAQVTKALKTVPGVAVENVAVGSAEVSFDPSKVERTALAQAVTGAGYAARLEDAAACSTAPKGGRSCGCCLGTDG